MGKYQFCFGVHLLLDLLALLALSTFQLLARLMRFRKRKKKIWYCLDRILFVHRTQQERWRKFLSIDLSQQPQIVLTVFVDAQNFQTLSLSLLDVRSIYHCVVVFHFLLSLARQRQLLTFLCLLRSLTSFSFNHQISFVENPSRSGPTKKLPKAFKEIKRDHQITIRFFSLSSQHVSSR